MDISYAELHRKLGINVAYYRKLKGLTQIELAEMIQKSRTYVSQLEAPQMTVNMTIDVLFKIAEVLEVHPATSCFLFLNILFFLPKINLLYFCRFSSHHSAP